MYTRLHRIDHRICTLYTNPIMNLMGMCEAYCTLRIFDLTAHSTFCSCVAQITAKLNNKEK